MENNRVESGIFGLDRVVEGGFRPSTSVVVVGASGTGKSTFAMQYIMHGILKGEQGLYITMEEKPEQIMNEAALMGWDMKKHLNKELFFVHLKGKNFKKMIEQQLPKLIKARKDYDVITRVAIDPMTPLVWTVTDREEQRELIGRLFNMLKELGPVLATVEEHSKPGETIGEDVLLPIYLSDGVIHLKYNPIGGAFNRTLEIIKMRGTAHGEDVYPYVFARGLGIVVRTVKKEEAKEERKKAYEEVFQEALETAEYLKAQEEIVDKIKTLKKSWSYDYSPEELLQIMFDTYKLK